METCLTVKLRNDVEKIQTIKHIPCHNWVATWDFQQCGMCDQQWLRPACPYAQSDQSLCWSLEYSMNTKLLNKHHLEPLSLKGSGTGLSESTLVKMPHCWKSHDAAQLWFCTIRTQYSKLHIGWYLLCALLYISIPKHSGKSDALYWYFQKWAGKLL